MAKILFISNMSEVLNLEYNRQLLLIKALNKYRFKSHAFRALGITEKQGFNLIKYHEVQLDKAKKQYFSNKIIQFKK